MNNRQVDYTRLGGNTYDRYQDGSYSLGLNDATWVNVWYVGCR